MIIYVLFFPKKTRLQTPIYLIPKKLHYHLFGEYVDKFIPFQFIPLDGYKLGIIYKTELFLKEGYLEVKMGIKGLYTLK